MATDALRTETPCAMMRREAESARREIRRRGDEISRLRSEIDHLQAQPDPDRKAIAALQQRLESLEEQLRQDELSLDTLEQVISENC
jgi:chromosome segregation ATPase